MQVKLVARTPNPQQVIYGAMHQDYSSDFVCDSRDQWPSESKCGEIIVNRLLKGDRGHYGCLEHPSITLGCKGFPHSVMQQARTHRVGVSFDVQCLAGDTEVTFVNCQGETNSKLKKSIAELYDLWTNGEVAIRSRYKQGRNGEPSGVYRRSCRKRLQKMRLRVLNESTGLFETGHIQDVMCSGVQPVYRVTLEDGKMINCTQNHRLFTNHGWQTMADAVGLVTDERGEVLQMERDRFVMCNGVNDVSDNLATLYRNDHQSIYQAHQEKELAGRFSQDGSQFMALDDWQAKSKPFGHKLRAHPVRVIAVEYVGTQMTYDLEVAGDWHNFVANGLVVHNSFRYTSQSVIEVATSDREVEEVFYFRPIGSYTDRQGKAYEYDQARQDQDKARCIEAARYYALSVHSGLSEEHARDLLPFNYRQHFIVSFNLRSVLHFMDLRSKKDAQLEIQNLCQQIWPHVKAWAPDVAKWYEDTRMGKARLAP